MQHVQLIAVLGLLLWSALAPPSVWAQLQPEGVTLPEHLNPRVAGWAGRDADVPVTLPPAPVPSSTFPADNLLSIAELESLALGNNPTIAQAQRQVEALRGKYVQQGLYPNPVMGYVGEEIGDEGRAGQQGVSFGQQIVTAGKLKLNRAVVSHEIVAAQQDLEIQRQRVINDVRAAAYEVLTAQRTIALTQQLVRIGEEGQEVAQELLKAREVSQVDLLQARIEANSAKVLLSNARNGLEASWRSLASIVGIPDMQPATLRDDLAQPTPNMTWQESLARLLGTSPELARAQANVQAAQCALARQIAGRIPDFDLAGSVRYNFASEDTIATVGATVPLQLYDRNQGNIMRAQAELRAAQQEVHRVEMSLQQRLANAFKDYANARQQVQRYDEEILPDAKESLGLIQQGYRQAEFGYLELLTAQRTYFRVNLDYVTALRDLWVSSTRIEGMLLTGALQAPGQ
jgi:cobalt-zinc-cadmium efflux system outer membrane protein